MRGSFGQFFFFPMKPRNRFWKTCFQNGCRLQKILFGGLFWRLKLILFRTEANHPKKPEFRLVVSPSHYFWERDWKKNKKNIFYSFSVKAVTLSSFEWLNALCLMKPSQFAHASKLTCCSWRESVFTWIGFENEPWKPVNCLGPACMYAPPLWNFGNQCRSAWTEIAGSF